MVDDTIRTQARPNVKRWVFRNNTDICTSLTAVSTVVGIAGLSERFESFQNLFIWVLICVFVFIVATRIFAWRESVTPDEARYLGDDVIKSVLATVWDKEQPFPVCPNLAVTRAMGVVAGCLAARSMLGHVRSLRDQFNVWAGELRVEASFTREKLNEHMQTLRHLDSELRCLTSGEIQSSGANHNLIGQVFSMLPTRESAPVRENLAEIQSFLEAGIRGMEELFRNCPKGRHPEWASKIEKMLRIKAKGMEGLYHRLEEISQKIDLSIQSIRKDWHRNVQQMQQDGICILPHKRQQS